MSEEYVYKVLALSLGIAAVLLGASVLIVAVHLGATIVSSLMLVIFQVLLTIAGIAISFIVSAWLISVCYSRIVSQVDSLRYAHGDLLKKINKRTPTFVASAALIASLILLIADKAFDGQVVPTICVGVVLALLFWIANELLVAESRARNVTGIALWIVAALFLPGAVLVYHKGNFEVVLSEVASLGLSTLILMGLAFLVAVFVPLAVKNDS